MRPHRRVEPWGKASLPPIRRTALLTSAILLGGVLVSGGCGGKRPTASAGAAPKSNNLNSRGLPKLTPEQVEEKVRAVQSSTTIPEASKANVIQSIRAQGEP